MMQEISGGSTVFVQLDVTTKLPTQPDVAMPMPTQPIAMLDTNSSTLNKVNMK
jgi:hypothetical protein